MGAMAAPIAPGKREAWEAWVAELNGPRKAEFDDMNERHGVTAHRTWLQEGPDGQELAIVVHDGPGAEEFMGKLAMSDHEFDAWFRERIAEVHGIDMSAQPPPPAERRL